MTVSLFCRWILSRFSSVVKILFVRCGQYSKTPLHRLSKILESRVDFHRLDRVVAEAQGERVAVGLDGATLLLLDDVASDGA